jgi:hypothetical protein
VATLGLLTSVNVYAFQQAACSAELGNILRDYRAASLPGQWDSELGYEGDGATGRLLIYGSVAALPCIAARK